MYLLYSAALTLAFLLASPYWLWQALRHGKYRAGLSERTGSLPSQLRPTKQNENCIWVHAVSVGEVMAITGLTQALPKKLGAGWRVVVSTTTLTGQQLARQRFGEENVFYLPLDFAFALRPFFAALRPRMLVLAETEFWPNMLRLAAQADSKIAVVNARISDRSFPRYRRFRGLLKESLGKIDLFLAQSESDRERLIAIGANAGKVQVSGNLKFEAATVQHTTLVSKLQDAIPNGAPVLVAGSTVEGEEGLLLRGFERILAHHPQAVMVLAPRHPERFETVASLLRTSQLAYIKRSEWHGQPVGGGVLLLDTIGELAPMYELATAAFVGGSLVPRGGHNILEPAQFGKPIFVGPYTQNFRDIISIFQRNNAVHMFNMDRLDEEVAAVFDPQWQAMGERGHEVMKTQSGALQRTIDALEVLAWMPSTIRHRYQKAGE